LELAIQVAYFTSAAVWGAYVAELSGNGLMAVENSSLWRREEHNAGLRKFPSLLIGTAK
jgi:hypothetical protein